MEITLTARELVIIKRLIENVKWLGPEDREIADHLVDRIRIILEG